MKSFFWMTLESGSKISATCRSQNTPLYWPYLSAIIMHRSCAPIKEITLYILRSFKINLSLFIIVAQQRPIAADLFTLDPVRPFCTISIVYVPIQIFVLAKEFSISYCRNAHILHTTARRNRIDRLPRLVALLILQTKLNQTRDKTCQSYLQAIS